MKHLLKSSFRFALTLLIFIAFYSVSAQELGDSVFTTPTKPTTADKITYTLFDADACCCGEFVEKSVTVEDTAIYLGYQYNDTLCQICRCLIAGNTTTFAGTALKAGTYTIYNAQQLYCPPGRMCPLYMMIPTKIGTLTVTKSTAVKPTFLSTTKIPTVITPAKDGSFSLLFNARAHKGTTYLKVADASGRIVHKQVLSPDKTIHKATISKSGLYFVSVLSDEGIEFTKRVSIVK